MTSLIHLEALWRFKQEKLEREIEDFVYCWNKNHKCKCCENWRKKDMLIECRHVEKKKLKKFGERNFSQFKSIVFIRSFSLHESLKH